MTGRKTAKPAHGAATPAHGTATPAGWSFYSSAATCWRLWYLRYVIGLELKTRPSYFSLGSTYHALQEGCTDAEVMRRGPDYVENLQEAKRLKIARGLGPKLPKATEREVLHYVLQGPLAGKYTARPDRLEVGERGARTVRDFKTCAFESRNEAEKWQVNGEIIGEMLVSNAAQAIVDIVTKAKNPKVLQFTVARSDLKDAALAEMVLDLQDQMRRRLVQALCVPPSSCFPRNLNSCVGQYLCGYYDWCWHGGTALTKVKYIHSGSRIAEWGKFVLNRKDLEALSQVVARWLP